MCHSNHREQQVLIDHAGPRHRLQSKIELEISPLLHVRVYVQQQTNLFKSFVHAALESHNLMQLKGWLFLCDHR